MKNLRLLLIVPIAITSLLVGSVLTGNINAGRTATYYACADAASGALRRVQPEVPCAEGEERLVWSDGQPQTTPVPMKTTSECEANINYEPLRVPASILRGKNRDLATCNLRVYDFSFADLSNSDLRRANFLGTTLEGANLTGADLTGADLQQTNLSGANLKNANLREANLKGANIKNASLIGANLAGTTMPDGSINPGAGASQNPESGTDKCSERGPLVDLRGCDFSGADLSGADLRGANLIGVNFESANLEGADFSSPLADLSDPALCGPNYALGGLCGALFSGANLRNANLAKANLNQVYFAGDAVGLEGANLDGANFDGATMHYAAISNSSAKGAFFTNVSAVELSIVFSDLDGADFRGILGPIGNFYRNSCRGTNLSGVDLSGHSFYDDFSGTFKGIDFTDADLSGTNFTGANLSASDFTRAKVEGAIFIDAILIGAIGLMR